MPWNFSLMFTSGKMGLALAAGNAVVLKPSEITPLSTLRIVELMAEVGFPAGVVNVAPGYGNAASQRPGEHPGVGKKIVFTGSAATGRRIVEASQGNLKRVQLELGGKGANAVFHDADLDSAIKGAPRAILHNHGHACIAGSRLILYERIADQFLDRFVGLAASIHDDNSLDPDTEIGPPTSLQHLEHATAYVDVAREQRGRVLTGGTAQDASLADGYYVRPTAVEAKTAQDRIAQEDVFGPLVTVLRFGTDDEALQIANGTDYGRGRGLWTRDLSRAHCTAAHIHAGMWWIDCYKRVNPGGPFSGVGQSGSGPEMGHEAMHDYTEARSVWVNVDGNGPPHFKH
ncbi:betaine-aldehyde dehydrogenase [Paraburkholderia phenoliruptrix BR3459a]|uniref:Betaine-aldehyde dehydrogenase n=1 Tax=Paraburkholderia phenoliruptrix BR3459a TaxID=1229205 RepID=K0DIY9_9BURK|nr:betaine-aldehyde dehydrogenase [Paraburkholderia phenoliruptrix BR3459a]